MTNSTDETPMSPVFYSYWKLDGFFKALVISYVIVFVLMWQLQRWHQAEIMDRKKNACASYVESEELSQSSTDSMQNNAW